ncbi:serine/threonine protein kinase [Aspergillus sergii]|uniref:Serine/threonine protein kinase n=1 Tax=Aspergillus sergii TaxID=1034303 RepID=A0A5N6WJS0_9EURO|nr:serine/threonine protein kinase [Aspergillus sergii]
MYQGSSRPKTICTDSTPGKILFSYSCGRFLYNEESRLRERYVKFDITSLKKAVSDHVGHGHVQKLEKLSEGGFNPVPPATMQDGFGAFEVATLSFLRAKGIPVPEVYGWSSTTNNPVGVEYIVMEYAPGIWADWHWFTTTKHQKHALVTGIVDIEKTLFNLPFASIDSIYFKKDIPSELQGQLYVTRTPYERGASETYCIGPIAIASFGADPRRYLSATASKEVEWTKWFGKSLECDFPHNIVFPGTKSHEDYIVLPKKYLSIAPYLLPKEHGDTLNRPTIRHPSILHTVITPLSLAAGYPRLFENPDPEPPQGLNPSRYPEGNDAMSPEEKAQVDELIRRRSLFYLYRWSGNLMTLRGALIRMRDLWPYVPGKDENLECPISFSEEVGYQTENEPMWYNLNMLVSHWRGELGGLTEEGWVSSDKYYCAVGRNESLRKEFAEGGSADELEKIRRGWPFQGHEEIF